MDFSFAVPTLAIAVLPVASTVPAARSSAGVLSIFNIVFLRNLNAAFCRSQRRDCRVSKHLSLQCGERFKGIVN